MRCKRNYCFESLAGPEFQRNAKNKSKIYLVRIYNWLSLPPALQKSKTQRSSLHRKLPAADKISTEKEKKKDEKKFGGESEMSLSLQPGLNESSSHILHQNHGKRNCEKGRKNLDAMSKKH
jgi:hypothetical protein